MSNIIRLQNLPQAANSADVRQYFQGLSIPNGGVFIVGGEKDDAFISFSTNEDVRQAVLLDNGYIKGVQIRLLMSSRNEMQNVVQTVRQQSIQFSQNFIQHQQPPQLPITESLPPVTAKPPQQEVKPDEMVPKLRKYKSTEVRSSIVHMSKDTQHKQSLLQQQHHSRKSSKNKDRNGGSCKKTKSKSSGNDGHRSRSRLDRSRSRDRRRRRFDGPIDRAGSRERHRRVRSRNSRSPVAKYNRNGQQQPPAEINKKQPPETAGPGAALKKNDCVPLFTTSIPVLQYTYKENVEIKHKSSDEGGKQLIKDNVGNSGDGHNHLQQSSQQMLLPSQPPSTVSMPAGHVWSNCVYLYGLPTTVTNTDIVQFFKDTPVMPEMIHIMLSKFGRPTGDSYCEFGTPQQAHVALLSKNHCLMGSNRVYIKSISRWDMIQTITKPMQQRHNILPPNKYYKHQQQRQQMLCRSSCYGGGSYGDCCTPCTRGANTGSDGFGQPGCVVALDNVPYRANVQDIVDFFCGFELDSENVIRRFNNFGKPTGEMRVNLKNPQEAMRAIRTLQNKPIYDRSVYLTLL